MSSTVVYYFRRYGDRTSLPPSPPQAEICLPDLIMLTDIMVQMHSKRYHGHHTLD